MQNVNQKHFLMQNVNPDTVQHFNSTHLGEAYDGLIVSVSCMAMTAREITSIYYNPEITPGYRLLRCIRASMCNSSPWPGLAGKKLRLRR